LSTLGGLNLESISNFLMFEKLHHSKLKIKNSKFTIKNIIIIL